MTHRGKVKYNKNLNLLSSTAQHNQEKTKQNHKSQVSLIGRGSRFGWAGSFNLKDPQCSNLIEAHNLPVTQGISNKHEPSLTWANAINTNN